jgi:hypothetical protein
LENSVKTGLFSILSPDVKLFALIAIKGIEQLEISLTGIVAIAGNYGSGKTEVAINLAIERKLAGVDVQIADLDLVNPYFRSREAKDILLAKGIESILPPDKLLHADLPILTPAVAGMIVRSGELALLDCGGDDVGVKVLGSLADSFKGKKVQLLQVINPFRPFTNTCKGCLKIKGEIEKAAKLNVCGIIGNANLIDETKLEDIYHGYDFMKEVSDKSGQPVIFITANTKFTKKLDMDYFDCPVLPMERRLVLPWDR